MTLLNVLGIVGEAVGVAVVGTGVGKSVGSAVGLGVDGLGVGLRKVGETVGEVVATVEPKQKYSTRMKSLSWIIETIISEKFR